MSQLESTTPTDLAKSAARLFAQRQRAARDAVRTGRMDPRTATQHLRPWLAIACRIGADLPELEEGLANLRTVQLVWPTNGAAPDVTDAEARARLADEICPRSRWAPILAAARDRALGGPLATPEQCRDAIALRDIAAHFACDPNADFRGKGHHVPVPDLARLWAAQQGQFEGVAA